MIQPTPDLLEQLQSRFGLDEFRPAQREVIEDVLAGRDVLCVMPTGAGKSLCYQLPAIIHDGLSIVVSPLISLMEDQVQQLRDQGINASMLNSTMNASLQRKAIAQIEEGVEGLLYVAPERFFAPNFQSLLSKLKVKLFAIDEAHCVSHWGHDFRPEYSRLGEIRRRLGMPTTIALTATATDDVRADIIRGLELREPRIVVTGFDRPNLSYECRSISKVKEKVEEMTRLVGSVDGSAIIYCSTRKKVDELTPALSKLLKGRKVVPYHAGMNASDRTANQERFMQTPRAVAVATNAFGMGINKPDVRLVVHFNVPGTLEAYYQEAGRAGRDGLPARCVLFYSFQDKLIQDFFIEKIGEERGESDSSIIADLKQRATDKLELMVRYARMHRCRRKMILDYFGDETEVADCRCDICTNGHAADTTQPGVVLPDEIVRTVRQILSAIARLHGKFGVTVIADTLAGAENERALRWQLHQLTVFGLLKQFPAKRIIAMIHRVIETGLAQQKNVGREQPIHVLELTASGIAVMKGEQPPPMALADMMPRPKSRKRSRGEGVVNIDIESQEPDAESLRRFELLRAVRIELAKMHQLPAYCICHDATLKLIAQNAPNNLEQLEQIKGMGPNKVRMYGKRLLEAMSAS